jgi:hypothetical protein
LRGGLLETTSERKLVERCNEFSCTTRLRLEHSMERSDWSAPRRSEIPACEAGCRMIAVPRKDFPSLSSGKLTALIQHRERLHISICADKGAHGEPCPAIWPFNVAPSHYSHAIERTRYLTGSVSSR